MGLAKNLSNRLGWNLDTIFYTIIALVATRITYSDNFFFLTIFNPKYHDLKKKIHSQTCKTIIFLNFVFQITQTAEVFFWHFISLWHQRSRLQPTSAFFFALVISPKQIVQVINAFQSSDNKSWNSTYDVQLASNNSHLL